MKLIETKHYVNGSFSSYEINDKLYAFVYYREIQSIKIYGNSGSTYITQYPYEIVSQYTEEEWFQYSVVDEWIMHVKQFLEEVY